MNQSADFLTIAICTFRREKLLETCLRALVPQRSQEYDFTILVIDNGGSESCRQLCVSYAAKYIFENRTGLAHARNRAVSVATSEWLFFLDDDGIAADNLVQNFYRIVQRTKIEAIGGQFHHHFGKAPPAWLRTYYQGVEEPVPSKQIVKLTGKNYLFGGIFAVKTHRIKQAGGFAPHLGMVGAKFGYGEEDELQQRLQSLGVELYYDPGLTMSHLVSPRKYTIKSQLQIAYAHGFALEALGGNGEAIKLSYSLWILTRSFILSLPANLMRVVFYQDFYWQNILINVLSPLSKLYGRWVYRVIKITTKI